MCEIGSGVTDPDDPDAVMSGHGNSEFLLCDDFINAVRGQQPNPIDVYKGIEMSLPGICAHASALSGGKPVQIPNFRP